jgi:hypothetical protein
MQKSFYMAQPADITSGERAPRERSTDITDADRVRAGRREEPEWMPRSSPEDWKEIVMRIYRRSLDPDKK